MKVTRTINIYIKGEEEKSKASYQRSSDTKKVKEKSREQDGKVDVLPKIQGRPSPQAIDAIRQFRMTRHESLAE